MCLTAFDLAPFSAFFCGDEPAGKAFALVDKGDERNAAAALTNHQSGGHTCRPVIENAGKVFDRLGFGAVSRAAHRSGLV